METQQETMRGQSGLTLIEVLIAGALLAVSLLAMAGMFITGYSNIAFAGRATTGLAAGRQILESAHNLPFESLANLDGFDTEDPASTPEDDPEREIARRWRYALAGDSVGWNFTSEEIESWPENPGGVPLGAIGRISVDLETATLARVTVEITIPGGRRGITLSTLVANP